MHINQKRIRLNLMHEATETRQEKPAFVYTLYSLA